MTSSARHWLKEPWHDTRLQVVLTAHACAAVVTAAVLYRWNPVASGTAAANAQGHASSKQTFSWAYMCVRHKLAGADLSCSAARVADPGLARVMLIGLSHINVATKVQGYTRFAARPNQNRLRTSVEPRHRSGVWRTWFDAASHTGHGGCVCDAPRFATLAEGRHKAPRTPRVLARCRRPHGRVVQLAPCASCYRLLHLLAGAESHVVASSRAAAVLGADG